MAEHFAQVAGYVGNVHALGMQHQVGGGKSNYLSLGKGQGLENGLKIFRDEIIIFECL